MTSMKFLNASKIARASWKASSVCFQRGFAESEQTGNKNFKFKPLQSEDKK